MSAPKFSPTRSAELLALAEKGAPIPFTAVVRAIKIAEAENSRRGEMFPQTADEHREDRAAARRTVGTLEFLGKQSEELLDWPKLDAPDLATELRIAVEVIKAQHEALIRCKYHLQAAEVKSRHEVTEYHMDGNHMYSALNDIREALSLIGE